MKTPIFQAPTYIVPSTELVFQRIQTCQFEAPTSRAPTLSLVQALTWFLEESNPLGLQPYLPLGYLVSMRFQPLGIQPSTSLRQNMFGYSSQLPKSSSMSPVNILANTALK